MPQESGERANAYGVVEIDEVTEVFDIIALDMKPEVLNESSLEGDTQCLHRPFCWRRRLPYLYEASES